MKIENTSIYLYVNLPNENKLLTIYLYELF